jgi:uncharacterized SAM-binding protein YcdF (DUF218 family)
MIESLLRQLLFLLQPIGLVWLALIGLTILLWRRRQRGPSLISAALALLITVIGGTDLTSWILWRLERPWPAVNVPDLPECDAALVLGGFAEPSRYEAGGVHLTQAADRVLMGIEVVRMGRSPVLVLGGGWLGIGGARKSEADAVKAWLTSWNLPADREIISLGGTADTRDEALHFAALAKKRGWRRVLLVTSASHMRRAAAVYRAIGIDPVPVPCNFLTTGDAVVRHFGVGIPGVTGFENFGIWMHEVAGWAVYSRRGWLTD